MATSEPSPVSDESSSEGSNLRNEPIAHNQPTAMSPRSALLAHTSLREHSAAEPVNTIIESSRTRRRNSASERRRKRERDLANAGPPQRELVRLLIDQEQEASILRKQLYIANQRVESEAKRAAELERANQQVTQRYREINETKVVVQQEASKAIQDSRLAHLELENAQKEIERAQEGLRRIERERDEAEAAAARARAKTRKLRQQQMVAAAREEGRRLGFEAGFEHARQERLLTSRPPRSTASRQNPRSSSRNTATSPYPAAENAPSHRSTRSPDQQQEDEEALRRSRLFDDLSRSPEMSHAEMSPSNLPIQNLPPIERSVNSPAVSTKLHLPHISPLRSFQPPPESTYESEPHSPSPTPPIIPTQEAPSRLADRSPSVHRYAVEIPPQEQIDREDFAREFNTRENPNDIIKQMPRATWVTAQEHRDIRGSPPAPYPGTQPPPLLLAQSKNVRPAKSPLKVVRFPSLAKTKQQAASWYRSLSFRKKNKPVIDPIDEVDQKTPTPTSATSNKGKAPEPNPVSTQASDSDSAAHYGVPPQPAQSWYKKSAPSSLHTTDAKRRPISGLESSPGLSQFELLFTPNVGTHSVKSGKEGKKLKEKDSYLSVINEEKSPTSDRFLTDAMRASSSRMASSMTPTIPNFAGVLQRSSHEAMGSKPSLIKLRHPLAITVPDPDEPLPPAGVAYSQPGPSNFQSHNFSLPHMASQSSTSPSIGIDVVPPSGFAPDPVQSPPHTGRNHLSPYHVFRPTSRSSSRIIPLQSITSLRSSGGDRLEPPQPPAEPRSGSRASTRRDPTSPRPASSRPQSAMNTAPHGNSIANKSVEDVRSSRSRPPRAHTPMMRETQASPRAESVRSSASKNRLSALNLSTSQSNLVNGQPQQQPQQPAPSPLNLVSPIRHSTSRVSLREAGSFSNGFDEGTYLDPAFYPGDRPSSSLSLVARDGHRSHTPLNNRPISRAASSVLSYV